MFTVGDIEAFRGLSARHQEVLANGFRTRFLPAGSVVCRRGEEGTALFAVVTGGVAVELAADGREEARRVYLGPRQLFGEMSLLSGQPVSATVVTVQDTWLAVLDRERFSEISARYPEVLVPFVQLLISRLRHRTGSQAGRRSGAQVLLVVAESAEIVRPLMKRIYEAVALYAPGSPVVVPRDGGDTGASPDSVADWPADLGERPLEVSAITGFCRGTAWSAEMNANSAKSLIDSWHRQGQVGRFLMLGAPRATADGIARQLGLGDAVLLPSNLIDEDGGFQTGLANRAAYRISARREQTGTSGSWYHLVDLSPSAVGRAPERDADLMRLARWLTHRSVGVAMGAGAALGFAHLGVLEVLDASGIPVDAVCGTSMGGAVALVYASRGNALDAAEVARRHIGSNRKVVDLSWLPRGAMLRGAKVHRAIGQIFGSETLDQLYRPSAVVAADLVRRERCVFRTGEAALAARATVAIPGLFPPVEHEGRVLVDGALVSRVPVGLLEANRCGLRIAVNVIPSPAQRSGDPEGRRESIIRKTARVFGMRHVIGESWEMLGWWHGALDAQSADVLIEPATDGSGYDFGAVDRMIEAGRMAALKKLPEIEALARTLLNPGVP